MEALLGRYLTPAQKAVTLRTWLIERRTPPPGEAGGRGFPDPDMLVWCDRLNALPGVCTLQSCAGHVFGDGIRSSGTLWIWLDRTLTTRFRRRAFELAVQPGLECVETRYSRWGQEIAAIAFAGNEQDQLDASMTRILRFFEALVLDEPFTTSDSCSPSPCPDTDCTARPTSASCC